VDKNGVVFLQTKLVNINSGTCVCQSISISQLPHHLYNLRNRWHTSGHHRLQVSSLKKEFFSVFTSQDLN